MAEEELMQYLQKSFSSRPASKAYRDNFDATFGKKPIEAEVEQALRDARERTEALREECRRSEDIGDLPSMILRTSEPPK